GAFTGPLVPVPEAQTVLFVGVLERYKNLDVLAAAWRLVTARVPDATLHLVGMGTQTAVAEELVRSGAVRWDRRLDPGGVAAALDASRALVLPSPVEGLGRVAIEAFLRGRAVVGTRSGGIPDIVEHERTGLLVGPGDVHGLARAIERMLVEDGLAERLGAAADEGAGRWLSTPGAVAERGSDGVPAAR